MFLSNSVDRLQSSDKLFRNSPQEQTNPFTHKNGIKRIHGKQWWITRGCNSHTWSNLIIFLRFFSNLDATWGIFIATCNGIRWTASSSINQHWWPSKKNRLGWSTAASTATGSNTESPTILNHEETENSTNHTRRWLSIRSTTTTDRTSQKNPLWSRWRFPERTKTRTNFTLTTSKIASYQKSVSIESKYLEKHDIKKWW